MRSWIGVLVCLALVLGALWGVTLSGAARREAERAAESAASARAELDAAGAPALEAEGTDEPREAQRTPLAPSFEAPAFPSSELAGRVEHADGRPASGIEIEVRAQGASERSRPLVTEACAEDGSFLLRCLGRGPFELRAHRSSLRGTRLQATLEHVVAGSRALVLTLPPLADLRGRVVDERGEPVPGFRLALEGPDLLEVRLPFHDPAGAFEVGELMTGRWILTASGGGLVDYGPQVIELPASEPLTVVLVRECVLAGVVLGPDGRPHKGARVTAEGFGSDSTDGKGAFLLRGPPGRVELGADSARRAPSAPSAPLALVLAPGEERNDLVLSLGPSGRIEGRAVGRDGQPLAGRIVHLLRERGIEQPEPQVAFTDAEGRFSAEVAPGRWSVSLERSRDGLEEDEPLIEEAEVAAGGRVELRLSPVGRTVRLHGRITMAGSPATLQRVTLISRSTWSGSAELEGSDYALELPRPGTYLLRAWLAGCEYAQSVQVPEAAEHRFDLELPVGWIEGHAREADGRALAGLGVRAQDASTNASTTTDAEGRFVLEVPPGEYRVTLESWHDATHSARADGVRVAAGERRSGIELVRAPHGVLRVRLVGPDAALLKQGRVRLENLASLETVGVDAEAGSARFDGLAPGRYRVHAESRWHVSLGDARVELAPFETRELELVLARGEHVFVRVHHVDTKPGDLEAIDADGRVHALKRSGPTPGAAPDAPGVRSTWFQHRALPPGDYLFRAWTEERSSLHALTVPDGAAEPVELELRLP